MSGWPDVALGDVCEFKYGRALPAAKRTGGTWPVYGSNGKVGTHVEALTSGPTIIVGRKGSFGEVHYSGSSCWPIDTTYFIDSTTTKADLRWLAFRLGSMGLKGLNRAAAIPGLNRDDAYRQRLMLPPLSEQRRIAAILDQADALRAKRRQVLVRHHDLTQSIFDQMFDGLAAESAQLSAVADVSSGITKGRRTTEPTEPWPYLAVSNVQAGYLKLDVVKSIDATVAEVARYALEPGDLVLTEGGDPDKLGRGTVWRGEIPICLHQNHIFRVRIASGVRVLPEYLSSFMASRHARAYFLRAAKQTTGIASINMSQLKSLPVPLPPMSDQSKYVERLHGVTAAMICVEASLQMQNRLFASLQSRAFRGEL